MGRLVTDLQIRALADGRKASETIGTRGDGALLFWRRSRDSVEAYYRYRDKSKSTMVKIGQYKATRNGYGFTLSECREKAYNLAKLRRESRVDLKDHLEAQAIELKRERQVQKRQAEIEASRGTLKQLCDSYVASLRRKKKKSVDKVEKAIERHVLNPFPQLSQAKARDITPDDIISIIRRIIEGGGTTIANRVRSYLSAAFAFGINADNDPLEQVEHSTRFHIEHNPVAAVPTQKHFERVRERTLSHSEVERLWHDFDKALSNSSPIYGLLLRFMFAVGGNRPEQLTECEWSDVDFKRRTLTFWDGKGTGDPRKRVMPLTSRALNLLYELEEISGSYKLIFSLREEKAITVETLGHRVGDYCDYLEAEAKEKGEKQPERFTAKDIRRTATSLLIDCGIPREQRWLIQSREDGSIESKHYDHSDRLPEKREALKKYDAFLDKILKGEDTKLVDLDQYRQASSKE